MGRRPPPARPESPRPAPAALPTFPFTLLDVFTAAPLAGNGLAVVHEADSLDEATMLAVAREMRLSETAFLQAPSDGRADYRNRIFTVLGELPFAGHPSLGAGVAVAARRGLERASLLQETQAGRQAVEVSLRGGHRYASMLQEKADLGPEVDPTEVLGVAGLEEGDRAAGLPPQVVSTGLPNLIVPVGDRGALGRASLDGRRLAAVLAPLGATVLYLAWCDVAAGRARARAFFGAGEDPATGSAAGSLCAYLHERCGVRSVEISQGIEIDRPSRIEAAVEGDRVRVGGYAVVVVEGELRL